MIQITYPDTERKCKALLFGPTGAGKTYLLGTADDDPRTAPIAFLDYEGGTSTLAGRSTNIFKIRSWTDFEETYAYLLSGNHPYRSIAIDSISEAHIFALLTSLAARDRKIADLLEQGDYGIALVQMRKLLRKFRDLPLHVFTSALAKDELDPKEGMVKKPAFSGALADEAPGIFEMVAYLSTGVLDDGFLHRILVLQNYPKLRTKIRMPMGVVAPNEIVDPTVTDILNVLGISHEEEPVAESTPESAPAEEQ